MKLQLDVEVIKSKLVFPFNVTSYIGMWQQWAIWSPNAPYSESSHVNHAP